jgi:hypothetical protein
MDNDKVFIYGAIGVVVLLVLFRASPSSAGSSTNLNNLNTSGLTTQAESTAQQNADNNAAALATANTNNQIAVLNAQAAANIDTIQTNDQLSQLQASAKTLYTKFGNQNPGYPTAAGNTLAQVLSYFTTVVPANSQNTVTQQENSTAEQFQATTLQNQVNAQQSQAKNAATASQASCNGIQGFIGCATSDIGNIVKSIPIIGKLL